MSGGLTETAMLAKLGLLDDDREPCNNDLGPTKPDPWDDYSSDDWQDPQWMECLDLIAKDPLLGVLLGAPHEVIFPDGCPTEQRRQAAAGTSTEGENDG